MPLTFTRHGHLTPSKEILSNENELTKFFVDKIIDSITRKRLYDNYLNFINEFIEQITPNFTVWINGSFVTLKLNPNDIDFVVFLEGAIVQEKQKELEALQKKYETQNLDLYFVKVYPKNHKRHFWYISKQMEWRHLFTKTKQQKRTRKSFSKGFLKIEYHEHE